MGILIVITALCIIPKAYNYLAANPETIRTVFYSNIKKDFITTSKSENSSVLKIKDSHGNVYSMQEYDSILPTLWVKQLAANNRFPDSINGIPVTAKEVSDGNFVFQSKSQNINCPQIKLYQLLESQSERVDIKLPNDVFRINKYGIEFIIKSSNGINTIKSKQYTATLISDGFVFPHSAIAGNASSKKNYDNGFLIADKNGKLFHLKQYVNTPYIRNISFPENQKIKEVYVTEFKDEKLLGFAIDMQNNLYTIENPNYKVTKVDIPPIDPNTQDFFISGNIFDWTIRITHPDKYAYYAIDAKTKKCILSTEITKENQRLKGLKFKSSQDGWIFPHWE